MMEKCSGYPGRRQEPPSDPAQTIDSDCDTEQGKMDMRWNPANCHPAVMGYRRSRSFFVDVKSLVLSL